MRAEHKSTIQVVQKKLIRFSAVSKNNMMRGGHLNRKEWHSEMLRYMRYMRVHGKPSA